ncbi:hypothetical protein GCM10007852_13730 [Agaribacter marinus]|uniref:Uncharacterized protein n=1 Tax=Agaribacter marinus TaxID=1431249 RepID=A0AA37T2I4_9ALTE|nr:hypothetical protein GCM10007852_13730 [Agaribacter marinus]
MHGKAMNMAINESEICGILGHNVPVRKIAINAIMNVSSLVSMSVK